MIFRCPQVEVFAAAQDSVTVGGRTLAVNAQTHTIRIDPDAIWYSATVRIGSGAPQTPEGAPH